MHPENVFETTAIESQLNKTELGAKIQKHQEVIKKMKAIRREKSEWGTVAQSAHSRNTVNPIRKICDAMAVPPNPNKTLIKLHLGDPTLTGELPPSDVALQAIQESLMSHKHDGYGPAVGDITAREAVANKFTTDAAPLTPDDVILASGASHALQMAIEAIADPGDNILIPHPGFPLYSTLCKPHGIEDRAYQIDMNNGGQIDLVHLESLIDENTRAIIVNNPGNPTGVVFSKKHLEDVLKLAHRYRVPIIADEIYGDLVYDGAIFYPMADLSPKVPIISCDGIAKRWVVPGWRMGWCCIHDRYNVLADVKKGMVALSQKIVGPCSIVQGALPKILNDTPESFFDNVKSVLSANANTVMDCLKNVPGLRPLRPHGAMYMMIAIDKNIYGDETPFVQGLIREESVFCLPGSAFSAPQWLRLVLTYPEEVTRDACQRISEFCARRYTPPALNSAAVLDDEPVSSSDEGCDIDLANTDSE